MNYPTYCKDCDKITGHTISSIYVAYCNVCGNTRRPPVFGTIIIFGLIFAMAYFIAWMLLFIGKSF